MAAAQLGGLQPVLIGRVEIRPGTREVLGPAGRDVVEPKVMQVLMLLAAANGEIVTRDRLVQECWDGRAVSEDAISRVIQRLRRLSETLGAGGFVIKTVHKVGYRLLASNAALPKPGLAVSPNSAGRADGFSRRATLGFAATILAGGGPWLLQRDPGDRRADALIAESEQALRSGTPEADARAVGLLEQAVKSQSGNAVAWGRLALARTYVSEAAPPGRTAATVTAVQDAARRARAIDAEQIDALGALAILPPYYGDWMAAEGRMAAVLTRDAHHLPTRDARDFMLSAVGRGREGSRDRVRMAAEDPLHVVYQTMLIYAHWTLGDVAEADRAADRALALWPRNLAVWFARFYIFALTGRPERALAHLADAEARPELPPGLIETLQATGVGLASRRPSDIVKARQRLVAEVSLNPSRAISAVTLLSGLGEIDAAFQVADAYLLEQGTLMASVRWRHGQASISDERRRKTNMLFLPSSAVMRADPRFAVLMEQTGLAAYWGRAGVRPDYLAGPPAFASQGAV